MEEFYSLGFLSTRLSEAMAKAMNAALSKTDLDITQSQFVVLRCLYYNDGLSQFDIANLLSKDAAGIKRIVDKLEEKELAERRAVRTLKNAVHITEKGRQLMPSLLTIADEVHAKAYRGLSEAKQKTLLELLDKTFNNLSI